MEAEKQIASTFLYAFAALSNMITQTAVLHKNISSTARRPTWLHHHHVSNGKQGQKPRITPDNTQSTSALLEPRLMKPNGPS